MYDFAETKYRALEALGVDQETYSAIVVPSLLKKLPEQLRLTITWGEDHHEWNLEQLLNVLGHKVELREDYYRSARHTRGPCDESMKKKHTMNTGKQVNYQNCSFCLGGHKHEDCHNKSTTIVQYPLLIPSYNSACKNYTNSLCPAAFLFHRQHVHPSLCPHKLEPASH